MSNEQTQIIDRYVPTIDAMTMGPREQIFSWDSPEGQEVHFAIDRMLSFCRDNKQEVVKVQGDHQFAKFCIKHRGIEPPQAFRWVMTDPKLWPPVLFLDKEDGSHLLCDGHHRYVAAAFLADGEPFELPAWILPYNVWKQFIIKMPF